MPDRTIDYAGVPYISEYDTGTRNEVLTSDAVFSTVVSDYDANGNMTYQTDPIGLGNNLVTNSGFEEWDGIEPTGWTKLGTGGVISKDTIQFVNGNNSAKLVSNGSTEADQAILLSGVIPIKESCKYNVSWFVKTENAGTSYGGATADIHFYNANGIWLGSQHVRSNIAPTTGTMDAFIRKGARINTPVGVGASFAKIALKLTGGATQATAWFDDVQFEFGSVINQYNLVYNNGFEYDADLNNFPDEWIKTNLSSSDILDAQIKHSGSRSLLINGAVTSKNVYQVIEMPGDIGIPMHFSGWSRAMGVSSTGGNYQLVLQFNNEDNSFDQYKIDFTKADHVWQYAQMVGLSRKKFKSITIMCVLENQTGKVWFDNIRVRLAGAANAVMSSYNITQNGSMEIDNNVDNIPDQWTRYAGVSGDLNKIIRSDLDNVTVVVDGQSQIEKLMPFSDDYMVKISDTINWATLANNQSEPIKSNTTYTASAVVRTMDAVGSGAVLKFDILDSTGVYRTQKISKTVTGTTGWQRVVVTLTLSEVLDLFVQLGITDTKPRFRVAVGTLGATTGMMYFDAVRVSEGNELVTFHYEDTNNFVDEIINQDGSKVSILNDTRGNINTITDPNDNPYFLTYDEFDNLKSAMNPNTLKSIFYYDKNNNLKQIDNHGTAYINTSVSIQYNELQLPKAILDALWRPTYLEYDRNANLISINPPNLKQINYQYDTNDRIREKSYSGGSPIWDSSIWTYNYDENDNLLTINKNGLQTEGFTYDEMDRVVTESIKYSTAANTATYGYDPNSQLLNASYYVGGKQIPVIYEYDNSSYNVDITVPSTTQSPITQAAFMYDEESRIKKSFIWHSDMSYVTYRQYDEANRIVRLTTDNGTGKAIFDYTYEYDLNGNRVKEINKINKEWVQYFYDSVNQLLEERYYASPTDTNPLKNIYTYDLLGNRKRKTINGIPSNYGYNTSTNELTTLDGVAYYTHDKNGNMITSGNYEFIYNAENLLVQVKRSGIIDATYEYNWQGLRNKKTTGTKVEYYYYTGTELTYITDQNNALKYFFVRDTNGRLMHMLDYKVTPVKAYTYIHDVHGNIVGLADSSGSIVVSYEYDAWGVGPVPKESLLTGSGELLREANPFRYSGYQYDVESGLYYLKARYYSPGLGRFLTMDPLIGVNRYAYANNNPVNIVDPSGNITEAEIKSYKEGKLSKQQYETLMKLTEAYYLAPDKQSRTAVHSVTEKYRKSKYTMYVDVFIGEFVLTDKDIKHAQGMEAVGTGFALYIATLGFGEVLNLFVSSVGAYVSPFVAPNILPGKYKMAVITLKKDRYQNIHYDIVNGPKGSAYLGLRIRYGRRAYKR